MNLWINPDCRDGKHRACHGDAWDVARDVPTTCDCECHDWKSAESEAPKPRCGACRDLGGEHTYTGDCSFRPDDGYPKAAVSETGGES